MSKKTIIPSRIVFSSFNPSICPVCKEPPKDYVQTTFCGKVFRVCKHHLKFDADKVSFELSEDELNKGNDLN